MIAALASLRPRVQIPPRPPQANHRRLENTLIYSHLVNFRSDDYTSAVAKDINEAQKLVESGFEYVTTFDSLMLFRKRK
jgi:hypothetical protein